MGKLNDGGSHLILHEGECRDVSCAMMMAKGRKAIKMVTHYDDDCKAQVENFEKNFEGEQEKGKHIDQSSSEGFRGRMEWTDDQSNSEDSSAEGVAPKKWMTMLDQSRAEFRIRM